MSFTAGQTIGDYTIIGLVGSGAVSSVFKARHSITKREEALKILKVEGPDPEQQSQRFMREIRVQASLDHPNIVPVHHAFYLNQDLVMVMDLVEGTSLRSMMDRRSIPAALALDYVCQALKALGYAHSRSIVHRDVSPANMIVTPEGVVRLTDFGLAKAASDPQLTQTGAAVGSLYYMSPEQVKGVEETDARSDIYSVGAVLYELVTGRKLFEETDAFSIMLAQVERAPAPPSEINSALPLALNDIILRAVAKDPEERFQSAEAFRSALERINQFASRSSSSRSTKAVSVSRRGSTRSSVATQDADYGSEGDHHAESPPPRPGRNGSGSPPGPPYRRDGSDDEPGSNGPGYQFSGFKKPMQRKNLLESVGARSQNVHFFIASCLLATVSWYTTEQGMGLYLSTWLALFSSIGVQSALVFVAWRLGITKSKRGVLMAVYAITVTISVSFSYVNLFTWFSAKERPAEVQRELFETINKTTDKITQQLAGAIAEGQKHVLALTEMTSTERSRGHMSIGQDGDPYLAEVRQAVAQESQATTGLTRGGGGEGAGYFAFARYTKMSQQSVERMMESQRKLTAFRAQAKPTEASDQQLRDFREVYATIPWDDVEKQSHTGRFDKPEPPKYSDYLDQSRNGQEDLLMAFRELFSKPTGYHSFAFILAVFVDAIVSLLAYAAGPVLFGNAEKRWFAAGAALDALDSQVFVRDFLRKMVPDPRGMARVDVSGLSAGEQQVCLILASKELAATLEENGKHFYLLSPEVHEQLLETSAGQ